MQGKFHCHKVKMKKLAELQIFPMIKKVTLLLNSLLLKGMKRCCLNGHKWNHLPDDSKVRELPKICRHCLLFNFQNKVTPLNNVFM